VKHGSDEFRELAARGTILRCQVGSGVHGIAIDGHDDRDEMGICIEPPEYVIGLRRFEQYEYRTQPEHHRSGPGDLDLVIYGLRKWMRLALQGNPSVLLPLFVPDDEIVSITPLGRELRECTTMILSRQAGHRFAGYLEAQRRGLLSRDGKGRCPVADLIPHRRRPCASCPWRTDTAGRLAFANLVEYADGTCGKPGSEAALGAVMFACHSSRSGATGSSSRPR